MYIAIEGNVLSTQHIAIYRIIHTILVSHWFNLSACYMIW